MKLLKAFNLGLSFALELCMLAALGYWGFHNNKNTLLAWGIGIGLPLGAATLWGLFLAPQARRRFGIVGGVLLSSVLFGLALLALAITGHTTLAIAFGAAAILNRVLLLVWAQW